MNAQTAKILNETTRAFYDAQAVSFSQTRQAPWAGWRRVADCARGVLADSLGHSLGAVPAVGECTGEPVTADKGAGEGIGAGECEGAGQRAGEATDAYWNMFTTAGAGSGKDAAARAVDCWNVPCNVLDVAGGNLRFEQFLSEEFPGVPFRFHVIDACEALAQQGAQRFDATQNVRFTSADVIEACGQSPCAATQLFNSVVPQGAQAVACFGFFHHVPGAQTRTALMRALLEAAAPGGIVAVSLWRFMDNPDLATRALASHDQALARFGQLALDEGDYLVGWQHEQGVFRYCHSFSDADAQQLIYAAEPQARLIDRFRADGRTRDLNEYLVFQKRAD